MVLISEWQCRTCTTVTAFGAAGGGLELPAAAVPSASLSLDQPLLHMTVAAVASDAAPVILGMSPDRLLKRSVLPKEVAGWSAVKGKHLSVKSSVPGPQKVTCNRDFSIQSLSLLALC